MSQDFHGSVGQVAAGDIKNYDVQINMATKTEERRLVPAQKNELYELSLRCVELGADSKDIWRSVFAELGVKQIGDISLEQFLPARHVLKSRLDHLVDEDDKRRLIGKILRAAAEKDAKAELNNFCDVTFGRTHLATLKRVELQRALEFMRDFKVQPLQGGQTKPPTGNLPAALLSLREFIVTYKANSFWLFMLGVIADRFLFH